MKSQDNENQSRDCKGASTILEYAPNADPSRDREGAVVLPESGIWNSVKPSWVRLSERGSHGTLYCAVGFCSCIPESGIWNSESSGSLARRARP